MIYYAIEYFIKEKESDRKISKVKIYETNKIDNKYEFISEPIYWDREYFIENIKQNTIFVKATMLNNKTFGVSDSFNLQLNNNNYINLNSYSDEDFITFIPIEIKN